MNTIITKRDGSLVLYFQVMLAREVSTIVDKISIKSRISKNFLNREMR